MPLPITKYCCALCGSEYRDYTDASMCEALGVPVDTDNIYTGQTIQFQNEESMFGSRYSYSVSSGTVLLKFVNLNTNGNRRHEWNYIIRDGGYPREHLAMFVQDDIGFRSLMSFDEWKYNPGFAEMVRQRPGVMSC